MSHRIGLLQWSHGRLTVVTRSDALAQLRKELLQWSHGRLTVVTHQGAECHTARSGFNGATVV